MRVLVVEDHLGMRDFLRAACEELGFAAGCAPSVDVAQRLLLNEEEPLPGVIVVDANLRGDGANRFLAWLERKRALCHLPVLLLGGGDLEPPFTLAELAEALSYARTASSPRIRASATSDTIAP